MRDEAPLNRALSTLIAELVEGTAPDACWVLNPGDPGLLRSLDRLTAGEASAPGPSGGPSIAAHVDHLCYGLELLNRWAGGDERAFQNAEYAESWRRPVVSDTGWAVLRSRLRTTTEKWSEIVSEASMPSLSGMELTGLLASVAHLAYHFGAIRQINRTIRGPQAND